mmetsp:Transcript_7933/g.9196  ORF Transcript_7933/g.9196 Transcript_7933/m.9196 type:complete len:205 (+) Transcript_7933:195-809(+)
MKFKFCGDMDAPEWVLGEITTLSKISSVRVKMLTVQVINGLMNGNFEYQKVAKVASSSNLSSQDVQASIAGLHFITASAAKYDVEDTTLGKELQQLGMPKEHSDAICRSYAKDKDALVAALRAHSLKLGNGAADGWSVDYILQHSLGGSRNTGPSAVVNMNLTSVCQPSNPAAMRTPLAMSIPADKFDLLLHELKTARGIMEEM